MISIARRMAASLLAAVLVFGSIGTAPAAAAGNAEYIRLTNKVRAEADLLAVMSDSRIKRIAEERADAMASSGTFAHDMKYIERRMNQQNVCWRSYGEIIAYSSTSGGTFDPARAINQWENSPGHYAIMTGDYHVAGGSYTIASNGRAYSAMIFVRLCSAPTASSSDTSAPTIVGRGPKANATGVRMSVRPHARFSEPVKNVGSKSVILRDTKTGKRITGRVTYNSDKRIARIRPDQPLMPKRTYRVIMRSEITDLAGNSLGRRTWTFTTGARETYDPARTFSFSEGTYTGYRFSSSGTVQAKKTATLSKASSAPTTRRSAIPGRSGAWHYVTAGIWAGYWVKDTSATSVR